MTTPSIFVIDALLCALLGVACIAGILNLTRIVEFFAAAGLALNNAG